MKRIAGINGVFALVTTALISVLWQAGHGQCCIGGRYGRYENWPSNNDWDELLMLLTGKYGKHGWGWQSLDSYAYSSLGDYPSGNLKLTSSPWESSGGNIGGSNNGLYSPYQGGSGSGGGLLSSGPSYSSGGGGSSGVSKLRAEKFKAALNNYFKSQPEAIKEGGWSGGGGGGGSGGGFVGESFVDSPRPDPPYDDSPKPGPPYDDNIGGFAPPYESGGGSWPGGGSGGGSAFNAPPPPPPSGSGDDHRQSSWPLPQGPPSSRPHDDDHPQSSPYNDHSNSHNTNYLFSREQGGGGGGSNQFQSDYDTFGKKRRRQGRRRSHHTAPLPSQQRPQHQSLTQARPPPQRPRTRQAGLRTKPVGDPKTPFKFPPYPGSRGTASRKQRRMGPPMSIRRRRLNTSFGGYKVDFSRFRFG